MPENRLTVQDVLDKHFVGRLNVRIGDVAPTTLVRLATTAGMKEIVQSIKDEGWQNKHTPYVILDDESMPTSEDLRKAKEDPEGFVFQPKNKAQVLDGNHRLAAAKQIFADDKALPMLLYSTIDDKLYSPEVIAASLNKVTATFAKQSWFDKIFFINALTKHLLRKLGPRAQLTPGTIATEFRNVGSTPPSTTTIRSWKMAVDGLSQEGYQTIEYVCNNSEGDRVNPNQLSWAFLKRDDFRAMKEECPLGQAIAIQILCRSKEWFKTPTLSEDHVKELIDLAKEHAKTYARVLEVFPKDDWGSSFKEEVAKVCWGKRSFHDLQVKEHGKKLDEEIQLLKEKIQKPIGEEREHLIRLRPCPRITLKAKNSNVLRARLLEWEERYAKCVDEIHMMALSVQQQQAAPDAPDASAGGDAQDEGSASCDDDGASRDNGADMINVATDSGPHFDGGGMDLVASTPDTSVQRSEGGSSADVPPERLMTRPAASSRKGETCPTCKPPASSKYTCFHCKMIHVGGGCIDSRPLLPEDELSKVRVCNVCSEDSNGNSSSPKRPNPDAEEGEAGGSNSAARSDAVASQRPKRMRRNDRPATVFEGTARSGSAMAELEAARQDNAIIHKEVLGPGVAEIPAFTLRTNAMLALVSLSQMRGLLETSRGGRERINWLFQQIVHNMDENGTIAVFVPHPWARNVGLLQDILESEGLQVEEFPVLLHYTHTGGGRPSTATRDHFRRNMDMILVAHMSDRCYINRNVTPDDVYGTARVSSGPAQHFMLNIPYPGTAVDIPSRAGQLLINRFTRRGETVMCVGAEDSPCWSVALERARRVEMLLRDEQSREGLEVKTRSAFCEAYDQGKFTTTDPSKRITKISPGFLPEGIPVSTEPPAITRRYSCRLKGEPVDTQPGSSSVPMNPSEAAVDVAKWAAEQLGYTININPATDSPELCMRPATTISPAGSGSAVPIWGEVLVFDSARSARMEIASTTRAEQRYVRLVQVLRTRQLRRILAPGRESCGRGTGIFLSVSPTCPMYYSRWDDNRDVANLELVSTFRPSAKREEMLAAWSGSISNGTSTPVAAKVWQRQSSRSRDGSLASEHNVLVTLPGQFVVRNSPDYDTSSLEESDSSRSPGRGVNREEWNCEDSEIGRSGEEYTGADSDGGGSGGGPYKDVDVEGAGE